MGTLPVKTGEAQQNQRLSKPWIKIQQSALVSLHKHQGAQEMEWHNGNFESKSHQTPTKDYPTSATGNWPVCTPSAIA
jgi:hypothetical protein